MPKITYRNKTQSLKAWAQELGRPYSTLQRRLACGLSVEAAFEEPSRTTPERLELAAWTAHLAPNAYLNRKDLALALGCCAQSILNWVNCGAIPPPQRHPGEKANRRLLFWNMSVLREHFPTKEPEA